MKELQKRILERLENLKKYEEGKDCPKDMMCSGGNCETCYADTAVKIVEAEFAAVTNKRMIDADEWIRKLKKIIEDADAPGEQIDYCYNLINEIEAEVSAQNIDGGNSKEGCADENVTWKESMMQHFVKGE